MEWVNKMKCEFWNEGRERCDARHIIDTYDSSNTPIRKKPNRYYKEICITSKHSFCWRYIHEKIINHTGTGLGEIEQKEMP